MWVNTLSETLLELSKIIGAVGIILGVVIALVRWIAKQEKQTYDLEELKKEHDKDLKSVQEELCVVNYAVLACLDVLVHKGYGTNVDEAHSKLRKHINNKAHKTE